MDTNDDIVQDHGFRYRVNWPSAPPAQSFVGLGKESDWISNADDADDLEVESTMGDGSDEIVEDSGFALSSGIWAPAGYTKNQYEPELNFVQLNEDEMKHKKKSHKK